MPEKISIYTCLAGVLNGENFTFGGEFVDGLARRFRDLLSAGAYGQAELVVSFIQTSYLQMEICDLKNVLFSASFALLRTV